MKASNKKVYAKILRCQEHIIWLRTQGYTVSMIAEAIGVSVTDFRLEMKYHPKKAEELLTIPALLKVQKVEQKMFSQAMGIIDEKVRTVRVETVMRKDPITGKEYPEEQKTVTYEERTGQGKPNMRAAELFLKANCPEKYNLKQSETAVQDMEAVQVVDDIPTADDTQETVFYDDKQDEAGE